MGHYASEIDPEWEAKSKRAERIGALKKGLESMRMDAFTVKEHVAVLKVFGLCDNGLTVSQPNDTELAVLEAKVENHKRKGPSFIDYG